MANGLPAIGVKLPDVAVKPYTWALEKSVTYTCALAASLAIAEGLTPVANGEPLRGVRTPPDPTENPKTYPTFGVTEES